MMAQANGILERRLFRTCLVGSGLFMGMERLTVCPPMNSIIWLLEKVPFASGCVAPRSPAVDSHDHLDAQCKCALLTSGGCGVGKESVSTWRHVASALKDQLVTKLEVEVDGVTIVFELHWHLGGDMKALCACHGHSGQVRFAGCMHSLKHVACHPLACNL